MKVGEKIKILVAEPWDFVSSDGQNAFYCTIRGRNNCENSFMYFAEVNSDFTIDGNKVEYIMMRKRNEDSRTFNIYCPIDNKDMQIGNYEDKNIIDNWKFIIIGSCK